MEGKSLVIFGATGLVGGWCLKKALETDFWDTVTAVGRKAVTEKPQDPRFREHVVPFEHLDSIQDVLAASHVMSALGTTMKKAKTKEAFREVDYGLAVQVARLAAQNKARHFLLVSATSANPRSLIYFNRVKGEAEQAVSGLGFASVSIFRPSLILGKRQDVRPAEDFAKSIAERVCFAIPKRYKPIEAKTIATAMVRAAQKDAPGVHVYESDAIAEMGA